MAGWATAYALVTAFLLLPVLIMIPASFGNSESLEFPPHQLSLRWYREVLGDRNWLGSAACRPGSRCSPDWSRP
jgi:ABC-type spermidine/putrescine transport system permease subunit II